MGEQHGGWFATPPGKHSQYNDRRGHAGLERFLKRPYCILSFIAVIRLHYHPLIHSSALATMVLYVGTGQKRRECELKYVM
jgi:hypothetical protein